MDYEMTISLVALVAFLAGHFHGSITASLRKLSR